MGHNKILAPASIITIAALFISLPDKAFAANECGADPAGPSTVSCGPGTYASGISYTTDGMTLELNNENIVITPPNNTSGIFINGSGDTTVNALNFDRIQTTGGGANGVGIRLDHLAASGNASVVMSDGAITSGGVHIYGIFVRRNGTNGTATATLNGGSITTTGEDGYGIHVHSNALGGSQITMNGGTINTQGNFGRGLFSRLTSATSSAAALVTMNDGIITTQGQQASGLVSFVTNATTTATAQATINGGSITTAGSGASGIEIENAGLGSASALMTDGEITATGFGGHGLFTWITNANSTATTSAVMEGGTISTADFGLYSLHSGRGNNLTSISGDSVINVTDAGYGLYTQSANGASTADARAVMAGGEINMQAVSSTGIRVWHNGNGRAIIEMSDGTVSAQLVNSDGLFAQSNGSEYLIDMTGGTVTGGNSQGAGIHTIAAAGGTVNIGADAVVNAGLSGIAIRDGDSDHNGTDEAILAGNAEINVAGTVNGNVMMGLGDDELTVTGTLTGRVIGDDAVAAGGDGNDIFTLDGGIWNAANFFGGNGTDTLTLENSALADMGASSTIDAENVNIDATSTLRAGGGGSGMFDLSNAHVFNMGLVSLGNSATGDTLIAGSWQAGSGIVELDVASPIDRDRLLIPGDMTGTTTLRINNIGLFGPYEGTSNTSGISVVQVGGNSTANAFSLENGYAAVGPFQYTLVAFDPLSSSPGELDPAMPAGDFWDYRLQVATDSGGNLLVVQQVEAYRNFTMGSAAFSMALLESLHKRAGEVRHHGLANIAPAAGGDSDQSADHFGLDHDSGEFYIRARGVMSEIEGDEGAGMEQDVWFVQGGYDWTVEDVRGGTLRFGPAIGFGGSHLQADNGAEVDLVSPSLAMTATYEMPGGAYIDSIVQGTIHRADISTPNGGDIASTDGWGAAVSTEIGKPLAANGGVTIEPQAQLTYQWIDFEDFTDNDGLGVELDSEDSLRGRLGVMVEKTFTTDAGARWAPHVIFDVVHELLESEGITAGGVDFDNDLGGTSAEIGAGIHAQAWKNTELYFDVSYGHALTDGAADSLAGTARMKFTW